MWAPDAAPALCAPLAGWLALDSPDLSAPAGLVDGLEVVSDFPVPSLPLAVEVDALGPVDP